MSGQHSHALSQRRTDSIAHTVAVKPCRGAALALVLWVSATASPAGIVAVQLVPGGGTSLRWKDIGDNTYAADYQAEFSYANATATLCYEESGATFTGHLVADGLKPNFAYQVKFTASHDNPAMERLGYLGRWWFGGSPLNVTDAYYEAHKSDPNCSSLLVFDYVVTDGNGHVEEDIRLDSTYHVLWRYGIGGVPGLRPPGAEDGPSIDMSIDPEPWPDGAYDVDYPPAQVSIYGEYEHTGGNDRPLPGELIMPPGYYAFDFVLTEESFHGSGPLDGWWSLALMSPPDQMVCFTVPVEVPEPCSLTLVSLGFVALLGTRGHQYRTRRRDSVGSRNSSAICEVERRVRKGVVAGQQWAHGRMGLPEPGVRAAIEEEQLPLAETPRAAPAVGLGPPHGCAVAHGTEPASQRLVRDDQVMVFGQRVGQMREVEPHVARARQGKHLFAERRRRLARRLPTRVPVDGAVGSRGFPLALQPLELAHREPQRGGRLWIVQDCSGAP